ncbi:MAG: hypothetical protein MPEBLZ_01672 [Candidatus Methanoperedens nitroreducens]|uniref:PLD phosphodiesterase domain-containing protein n=1 Tax=Candidatus Methanoperedens nitratireducens TaxID=1392998 RepID=A0A0P8CAH6_9EURY|nr:MAG: hypothetical protein MPEBLZ_01672 [Candidatus Methanoperedens sp. BLZ1]
MENFYSSLNPLPVILSFLGELDSDQFLEIVNRSGISINLNLSREEKFSHKTRIRAYIPRLNAAICEMSHPNSLHAIQLLFSNLLALFPGKLVEIQSRLQQIGWKITDGKLSAEGLEVIELFFEKGLVHKAYTDIRHILNRASSEIIIIDPYIDKTLFEMLKDLPSGKTYDIKILTKNRTTDFDHEKSLFCSQYPNLAIEKRTSDYFHDRFIIIDRKLIFLIGASIKDAGKKAFMIIEIEDVETRESVLKSLITIW